MTQHTAGLWELRNKGNLHGNSGRVVIVDADQTTIAKMIDLSELSYANAERIVACVNNCAGINPEAVPELLAALKLLVYRYECRADGDVVGPGGGPGGSALRAV